MDPAALLLVVLASGLTPMQTDSFLDHVVAGRSLGAVAREYGVSRAAVGQAAVRARRKMQKTMLLEAA